MHKWFWIGLVIGAVFIGIWTGYGIWGRADLAELERNLAASQDEARRVSERAVRLERELLSATQSLAAATDRIADLENRQHEITAAIRSGTQNLDRAIGRGETVGELIDRAIELVAILQTAYAP